MRKCVAIMASIAALSGVLGLSGCGGISTGGSNEPAVVSMARNVKAGKDDSIKIDDIEFSIEEGFWYDERKPVMTFTNNSDFDIITVDIEWTQNEEMTDEQRSVVFAEFVEDEFCADDDFSEYTIDAYKEQLVARGEESLEAAVYLNNTGRMLGDAEHVFLFEPSIMKVVYLGGDGKAYMEYLDFKTGKTKDASKGGQDVTMWPKSDLAARLPKIEAPVRLVTSDDEDGFWFETLGMTIEDFDAYVEALKEMGYDQVDYEDDDEFRAHDKDGYEATATFVEINGAINGHLDTSDVKKADEGSSAQQVSADFKKTMDEYESFFDEYVDFMKGYKDGGSPSEMAAEYADYMARYADTMAAISEMDADALTAADAAYLLEVQGRINSKVASI